MSEHQLPNANEQSHGSITPDPMPESGSFDEANDAVEFPPETVIAAQPISMVLPEDFTPREAPPRSAPPRSSRRRNCEEMSKRPSWLPEDWTIELTTRKSGATEGLIDPYYVEPSGKLKFRSKNEVLHFLATGSKLKRKANDADAQPSAGPGSRKLNKSSEPSESSGSQKATKSRRKGKESQELKSDSILKPTPLNSIHDSEVLRSCSALHVTPLSCVHDSEVLRSECVLQPTPINCVPMDAPEEEDNGVPVDTVQQEIWWQMDG